MPRQLCWIKVQQKRTRGEVTENGLQSKTSRVKATCGLKGYMQTDWCKRTDANGNRTLESVRKQLEEDGRKTEQQENGSSIETGYKWWGVNGQETNTGGR